MSNPHDDGGSAFPRAGATITRWDADGDALRETFEPIAGMSLRDYFAAQALNPATDQIKPNGFEFARVAQAAYAMADAMLEARKR